MLGKYTCWSPCFYTSSTACVLAADKPGPCLYSECHIKYVDSKREEGEKRACVSNGF